MRTSTTLRAGGRRERRPHAERRLATGTLSATNAAWSPDGTTIAFAGRLLLVAAGGGPATRVTSGRATDLDPAWQPSGLPSEVPVPAAPPSKATAEARVAGTVVRTLVELLAELKSDPTTSNAREAATAAGRVRATARHARSATTKLRVGTARGQRVRRLLLSGMRGADRLAADLSALSRSLRRHDARAARKHRQAIFGDGVGLFFPVSEAAELAGNSHADIALRGARPHRHAPATRAARSEHRTGAKLAGVRARPRSRVKRPSGRVLLLEPRQHR